ncbi:MAG: GMC oxidoreductase, partial [Nocardioides sp.]
LPRKATAPACTNTPRLERSATAACMCDSTMRSRLSRSRVPLAPYNAGELSPGKDVETDEQILDWVRADAETALHPSCTAKMGVDEMSVVDPATMKVHGLEGLRVVDASVFPYVTNGNIYAPVMMVAEKAADLIAGNTPLPPASVPFYRYRAGDPLYPPGDSRNSKESG